MDSFSNILTLVKPRTSDLISLKKSILLAKNNHARVTVLATKEKPSRYQRWLNHKTTTELDNEEKINSLIHLAKQEGISINYKIREERDQFITLKKQLKENQYDLVVAENLKKTPHLWTFEQAEYTHLLRVSDTSVLFVGDHQWLNNGNVLAAIETEENTVTHKTFNNEIIEKSSDLAKLLMSDIHLFNCYLESCSVSFQPMKSMKQSKNHLDHLTSFVKPYHFKGENLHVEEGLADDIIPSLANKYNANVVVMGYGEHQGWLSRIKGHTLDYVLNNLHCDLLALKQSNNHANKPHH